MEMELRNEGYNVASEVARLLHYVPIDSCQAARQLPHDVRAREDLLLPDQRIILELKQTKTIGDSEHQQLMRYMHERYTYDASWGTRTQGMLINYGDDDVEVWYMFYQPSSPEDCHTNRFPEIIRVLVLKEPIPDLNSYSRAFIAN